jgi:hypothetical protein
MRIDLDAARRAAKDFAKSCCTNFWNSYNYSLRSIVARLNATMQRIERLLGRELFSCFCGAVVSWSLNFGTTNFEPRRDLCTEDELWPRRRRLPRRRVEQRRARRSRPRNRLRRSRANLLFRPAWVSLAEGSCPTAQRDASAALLLDTTRKSRSDRQIGAALVFLGERAIQRRQGDTKCDRGMIKNQAISALSPHLLRHPLISLDRS